MLGIVWDVSKLVESIIKSADRQTEILQQQVTQMNEQAKAREYRIEYLENLMLKRAGFIPDDTTPQAEGEVRPTPRRMRNWREQREMFEKKFRPPELAEREQLWKSEAQKAAAELAAEEEANAGQTESTI